MGAMAVGVVALTAASAGAEDTRAPSKAVKVAPRPVPITRPAATGSSTLDVAVDEGASGTKLYRFDRSTGKLTLVKQLSQKEAPSVVSRFKDLEIAESQAPASKRDLVIAVAPEGKPPKGGPPGGSDPDPYRKSDYASLSKELARLKVSKAKVKVGTPQMR
ncbi:hypothetical protein G4177_25765 [Corallococcus sp. ZKHCc1 1396]|uniref:Uncharacterized protein n=1 Tax=Corallococcus soli TaxID=2710757 RepID=A0ABR9PUI6_9BACT|nr:MULTISPECIES: hypothetical protein [Corallococcus]MBE4751586.1 hypothetical protein [Corallococcus soli]MCY1030699.1 hypothetical protein [Corallococcus sp. BB11-1]